MKIIYAFHPLSDSWTGQEEYPVDIGRKSDISDSWDYHQYTQGGGLTFLPCMSWVQTTNYAESIVRWKGSFSLSALQVAPYYTDILFVCYAEDQDADPWAWLWTAALLVWSDGKLGFTANEAYPKSTNAISAGVTYNVEVVFNNIDSVRSWQLYVDGDLWLTDTLSPTWHPEYHDYPYIMFIEGLPDTWELDYNGVAEHTLHLAADANDNYVWTIEGPPGPMQASWTMNALL